MFEAVRTLANSRASRRLTHEIELPRRQSMEIELPSSSSTSSRAPPKRIFQKALRRLIAWVKIRGNLPCVLEADQWSRLLSTPIAILEEFQAAADTERRTGAEHSMLSQVFQVCDYWKSQSRIALRQHTHSLLIAAERFGRVESNAACAV